MPYVGKNSLKVFDYNWMIVHPPNGRSMKTHNSRLCLSCPAIAEARQLGRFMYLPSHYLHYEKKKRTLFLELTISLTFVTLLIQPWGKPSLL